MAHTTLVSPAELHAHLGDPVWRVADCRFRLDQPEAGRALYEAAHIPGAVYADLNRDLAGPPGGDAGRHPLPDPAQLRATLGRWGIGAGVQVVAYDDQGGAIAARLWWLLRWLGHEAVAVLDGGWPAWLAQGFPTASGVEEARSATFRGEPRPGMVASLDEVMALSRGEQAGALVDARDPARFRGETEPIDRVAGHIPGAQNRPFAHNLAPDGSLRPAETLAQAWQTILGDHAPSETILYCGSGVTACHNLLALEHAGLPGARLFVPSWSGWSADPARPVAVGEG